MSRKKGTITIKTPRVGVTLAMGRDYVRFGCPVCRRVLYQDRGTPHTASMRKIEGHVGLCKVRKEFLGELELVAVSKLENGR